MFYRSSSIRSIRPDTLAVVSIFTGCCAVLGEAYVRTELDDSEIAEDASYGPTNNLITAQHVRTLEREGIVVIPNALSAKELLSARIDIAQYAKNLSNFQNAEVGGEVSNGGETHTIGNIRQDLVSWLRPQSTPEQSSEDASDNGEISNGPSLNHCICLIRGVASSLSNFNYSDSHSHRVPQQCQLALYKGDGTSGYARHLDRCDSSLQELGLLEFLRLSDFRGRAVTVILYLNDANRTRDDGGALRCWLKTDRSTKYGSVGGDEDDFEPPFDVQPTGGKMIIFHSNRLEHQVLESLKDRYALTVWINGRLRE